MARDDPPPQEDAANAKDAAELEAEIARLRGRLSAVEGRSQRLDPVVLSLAENSPDNIMLLDRQGRIRFINRTVPDLTIEQVIGTPVLNYVPEAYHDTIRDTLEQVAQTQEPGRYDTAYVAEDGDISYWESRVGPVIEDGEVAAYAVTSSNVSERRKAAADRDRFFNLALDMLCVASFDGYFRRINPAFGRVLGYSDSELLDTPLMDFVHPQDRERTREAIAQLERGEAVIDFENRYRAKDGEHRWISWRAVSDPKAGLMHAAGRDVHEQRQLQDQVRHSQKLDAVGQLAGGIAHDFNNLVLAIQVNADFALKRADQDAGLAKHVHQIKAASTRAAELTRQLLAFSRQQQMDPEPLDLGELTRNVIGLIERLIPENIEVELTLAEEACITEGDRALLEQVLLNLCLNARDAMPTGGRLAIETARSRIDARYCESNPWAKPGRYVMWRVTDTGVGMNSEVIERIFEPFFTTKAPGAGTGLGLAMAYGIVKQHRGLLHVTSEPAAGASFEVYLPLSERFPAEKPTTPEAVGGGNETILVAEDDDMVRGVVIELLEEMGYTVIAARDGEEAVESYRRYEDRVDLLLLDIVMPRMSGPEALEEIRRLNPDVRALICSGYGGEAETTHRTSSPVLRKPYDPQTLLKRIRKELER